MKRSLHNRQLPVAKKYEDHIFKAEVEARDKILRERCLQTVPNRKSPLWPPITGTNIYVATYICNQQNAPGAWANLVPRLDGLNTAMGYERSTNQIRLQLESLVAALKSYGHLPGPIVVATTARSVAEFLNSGQATKWQRAGWKKASGDPVAYPEIWAELLRLVNETGARVEWTPSNDPVMAKIREEMKSIVTKIKSS